MTQGGSAIPVVTSTDAPLAGPALRVAVVSDRSVQSGPAMRLVEVTDGRATQGNPPIPVSVVTDGRATVAGPPIPVVVVSGVLAAITFYLLTEADDRLAAETNDLLRTE